MNVVTTWYESNLKEGINLQSAQVNVTKTYSPMRVGVNKETSLYEHSNESIEINALNTNDEMRNNLLNYDVLILEANIIQSTK